MSCENMRNLAIGSAAQTSTTTATTYYVDFRPQAALLVLVFNVDRVRWTTSVRACVVPVCAIRLENFIVSQDR